MRNLMLQIALAVAFVAGLVSAAPASADDPEWNDAGTTLTLAVGAEYNVPLKPDAAFCGDADRRTHYRVPATATPTGGSGVSLADQSRVGFQNQRGGTPYRTLGNALQHVNGLSLHPRGDALWLRGTPHNPLSGLTIHYPRICNYSEGGNKPLGSVITVQFTGAGRAAAITEHDEAHGHDHGSARADHTHPTLNLSDYARTSHTHPGLAWLAHAEHANTCRNLGGWYDRDWARGATPRSDPFGHCCIPAEASSGIRTAAECHTSKLPPPAQQQQLPPPLDGAGPMGTAPIPGDLR